MELCSTPPTSGPRKSWALPFTNNTPVASLHSHKSSSSVQTSHLVTASSVWVWGLAEWHHTDSSCQQRPAKLPADTAEISDTSSKFYKLHNDSLLPSPPSSTPVTFSHPLSPPEAFCLKPGGQRGIRVHLQTTGQWNCLLRLNMRMLRQRSEIISVVRWNRNKRNLLLLNEEVI